MMQQLCTAASFGKPWLGMPCRQIKTYALFCEDERDELQRRQVAINAHYGVSMGDLEDVLYRSRPGQDNILCRFSRWDAVPEPTNLFYGMVSTIRRFGSQLIVIDTASDVFGGNEIAKDQVRAFITLLRGLAIEIGACIVLTAHVSNEGLSSGSGLSGSRAWSNSVRARLWLTSKSKEGGNERYLKTMKANYGPSGGKIPLKWEKGVFVVSDTPPARSYSEPTFSGDDWK
jgi:RecA-family ATPase